MNEAKVIIHRRELPLGNWHYEYEWDGKRGDPAWIPEWHYGDMDNLPWPLKPIDRDASRRATLYVRRDTLYWPLTWLAYTLKRRIWGEVYYRLILTAVVWGLARTSAGVEPSWRDLNIFRNRRLK